MIIYIICVRILKVMGRIIDFHSHILPGIDDGSKNTDMSREILTACKDQGIEVQVATPHFYASHNTPERFLEKRDASYEKIRPIAEDLGIELLKGSEVAFFRGMADSKALDSLLIGDTDLLLLEMPFRQWTENDLNEIKRIKQRGIQTILAHIERFSSYQKDKGPYYDVLDMGLIVQVNAEALLSLGSRAKAIKLFKDGTAKLLASDCHNLSSRPQNLKAGRDILAKKLGAQFLDEMDDLGEQLLSRKR